MDTPGINLVIIIWPLYFCRFCIKNFLYVIPNDILKYPRAACSQQSIVGMKVLMDKGYDVRPVAFYDSLAGGHFCYEVKYEGDWHFYDRNREPDENVLNRYKRPGIKFLNENPEIMVAAYPQDTKNFFVSLYELQNWKRGGIARR